MTAPTIVFDLDGTLVDTAPDLVESLNHTIAIAGLAPVGYEDLTFLVGQGARTMIERSFALRGAELEPDALSGLLDRFITHYRGNMPGGSKPFPGLVEAFERLSDAGFALAVCTNKMESLAVPLIDKLGLAHHFAAVTGGDTFPVKKPDPGHLIETVRMAGGNPSRAVMIGDSINDILAARNASIPSVAVPFGYSDEPVEALGATHVIQHFDELTPELLTRLLAGE